MAKSIRVALLLFVLATVAVGAWQKRTLIQSWERTLDVVVYPINGDGRRDSLGVPQNPQHLPGAACTRFSRCGFYLQGPQYK